MFDYLVTLVVSLIVSLFTFLTFTPFLMSIPFIANFKKSYNHNNNSHRPRVNVIVSAHNEENVIKRCIKSILKQKYPKDKVQIILVDDGSTDATLQKMQKFKNNNNVKIIHLKNKSGKVKALNYALKFTKNELIAFFDADQRLKKNCLNEMIKYFEDEKVGVVTLSYSVLNQGENMLTRALALDETLFNFAGCMWNYYGANSHVTGSGYMVRKNVLDSIGGFDESFIGDDSYIMLAISKLRHKVIIEPRILTEGEVPNSLVSYFFQRKKWSRINSQFISVISRKGLRKFFSSSKAFFARTLHFLPGVLPFLMYSLLFLSLLSNFILQFEELAFVSSIGFLSALLIIIESQLFYYPFKIAIKNIFAIPVWSLLGLFQLFVIYPLASLEEMIGVSATKKYQYKVPKSSVIKKY